MPNDIVYIMTETFEGHAQETENGVEYWLARDLQHLLGYTKWDNFLNVISKAKTACDVSGHHIPDHFADVGKKENIVHIANLPYDEDFTRAMTNGQTIVEYSNGHLSEMIADSWNKIKQIVNNN